MRYPRHIRIVAAAAHDGTPGASMNHVTNGNEPGAAHARFWELGPNMAFRESPLAILSVEIMPILTITTKTPIN